MVKIFSRPPGLRNSKVRNALKSITNDPTPIKQVMEEFNVPLGSLKQGATRYPTPGGKVRFGYLEDGTHVVYRQVASFEEIKNFKMTPEMIAMRDEWEKETQAK